MAAKSCAGKVRIGGGALALGGVEQSSISSSSLGRQHAMRRQALDRERPGDADAGVVGVGLVVEIFDIGARGDRGVDLALAGDARLPPFGVRLVRRRPARRRAVRAGSATLPMFFVGAALSAARSGSSTACHFSQMSSISGLLAIDFSVMCGTRS